MMHYFAFALYAVIAWGFLYFVLQAVRLFYCSYKQSCKEPVYFTGRILFLTVSFWGILNLFWANITALLRPGSDPLRLLVYQTLGIMGVGVILVGTTRLIFEMTAFLRQFKTGS